MIRKGGCRNSQKVKESITFPRQKSSTSPHQSLRETVKMIATTKEQKGSRSSRRIGRRTCLAGVTISTFLCVSGIALCAVLITFVVLHEECPSCPSFVSEDPKSVWIFTGVASSLLISGGCIIVILTFQDRRINSPDSSFPEEVEIPSKILAQDPENSSAFVLPHPLIWPVVLPDYFTAVQSDIEAVPSVYCVNCSESQPPSYEEAVSLVNFRTISLSPLGCSNSLSQT